MERDALETELIQVLTKVNYRELKECESSYTEWVGEVVFNGHRYDLSLGRLSEYEDDEELGPYIKVVAEVSDKGVVSIDEQYDIYSCGRVAKCR